MGLNFWSAANETNGEYIYIIVVRYAQSVKGENGKLAKIENSLKDFGIFFKWSVESVDSIGGFLISRVKLIMDRL